MKDIPSWSDLPDTHGRLGKGIAIFHFPSTTGVDIKGIKDQEISHVNIP
jgi:hypothetical protein